MDDEVHDQQSIRQRIEQLEVGGESFARAHRFDPDEVLKDAPINVLNAWRNSVQATVWRIEKRTGMSFTIECGEFRTQSRDIIACLAVTRIK